MLGITSLIYTILGPQWAFIPNHTAKKSPSNILHKHFTALFHILTAGFHSAVVNTAISKGCWINIALNPTWLESWTLDGWQRRHMRSASYSYFARQITCACVAKYMSLCKLMDSRQVCRERQKILRRSCILATLLPPSFLQRSSRWLSAECSHVCGSCMAGTWKHNIVTVASVKCFFGFCFGGVMITRSVSNCVW